MRRLLIRLLAALSGSGTVVLIEDGRARSRRGRVDPGLLNEISLLAEAEGIRDALIRESGGHLVIRGVPRRLHQRVRNVWVANRL